MFAGFVKLGETITVPIVTRNSSRVPTDPASSPTYRVYGPNGTLMTGGSGSVPRLDTGSVTGATNDSPIVITSANHGLTTGTFVHTENIGGNTAANGYFRITSTGTNTFSLDNSTGNGTYTSGGTWHVAGLHKVSILASEGSGYEKGKTYSVLVNWTISGTRFSEVVRFAVV